MSLNPYCAALEALRAAPTHELKKVGDQWRSPDKLWWGINAKFGPFVLDLFADRDNAKCEAFYSAEDNALTQDWSARLAELNGAAYANPPYSRASQHDGQYITGMTHIMAHTAAMRELGGRYVFLIKAATGELWWPEDADHIAFIRGRISFDLPVWYRPAEGQPSESSAGFGAAIAIFDKAWRGPEFDYVSRDELEARGAAFMRQIELAAARLQPQTQQQNIPENIPPSPEPEEVINADPEIPLVKSDIITQSGFNVWACAAAAFSDKDEYTFSESKFAHTWAAESVESPVIVAVPAETVVKAIAIIEKAAYASQIDCWVKEHLSEELHADAYERLMRVSEECTADHQLRVEDFLTIISSFEHSVIFNVRMLRAAVFDALKSQLNDVWPIEVTRLADNIESLSDLLPANRRKVMQHINHLLLERTPSGVIISTAQALTKTFGEFPNA